jgi:hypothetical protein
MSRVARHPPHCPTFRPHSPCDHQLCLNCSHCGQHCECSEPRLRTADPPHLRARYKQPTTPTLPGFDGIKWVTKPKASLRRDLRAECSTAAARPSRAAGDQDAGGASDVAAGG